MEHTLIPYLDALAKRGKKTALVFRTEYRRFVWTYSELYKLSLRAAAWLYRQGLRKGDRILIWAGNSPEVAILFLGALRAGIVWVPFDVRFEPDFVEKVRQETEAKLLFVPRSHRHLSFPISTFFVEDIASLIEMPGPEMPEPLGASIEPSDLAEIIYTSGTTAQPKGVMLTHKNLAAGVGSALKIKGVGSWDNFLTLIPLSHAFAQIIGFFLPLFRGCHCVILDTLKTPLIERAIREEKITILILVPGILKMMRDSIERKIKALGYQGLMRLLKPLPFLFRLVLGYPFRWILVRDLRVIAVGGAALESDLEKYWNDLGVIVTQGYGLTETASMVSSNNPLAQRSGSVGRAVPDVEFKIAEDGEILVRGDNVTQGYFHREKETSELFKEGWMKTGDIGSMDSDGYLYIRDRKKDMIVTPEGLNIYPVDLETILNAIPGVRDSCVFGKEKEGVVEIHAVLLLERGAQDPKQIVECANTKLPAYQKIESFSVWPEDDFPRTLTFKAKKSEIQQKLRAREWESVGAGLEPAPKGSVSKAAEVIARVAKKDVGEIKPESQLGKDLNLSSIEKVELVSCLEEASGSTFDEDLIRDVTTVGEIEKWLEAQASVPKRYPFTRWTQKPLGRMIRWFAQNFFALPIIRYFIRVHTLGLDRLENVKGSVIFAANHESHLDTGAVFLALPPRWRLRLAPAAWQEFFTEPGASLGRKMFKGFLYHLCHVSVNIFLFPRSTGFRKSLVYAGELVDQGSHILVFPEGRRTVTGSMGSFEEGIGVMVSKLKIPVVPVRIEGTFRLQPRGKVIPKRGTVTVKFGQLLKFEDQTYTEIAKKVEEAVRNL